MERVNREQRIDEFVNDTRNDVTRMMENAATMEIINREQRIDEFVNDTRDEVIRMMEDAAKEADVSVHRQAFDWHLQEIARLVTAGNQQQAIEHCLLAVSWHQEQIQRLLL